MSRPLTLYILQKFGAPGNLRGSIFLPVEHKLRNNLLSKLVINVGHLQHIVDGFLGLPLGRNSAWHRVLIHHTSIKLPLTTHVLDKF